MRCRKHDRRNSWDSRLTVVLPLVRLAPNVEVVVVVLGIPAPETVIPSVRSRVEPVVTVVLPLVVSAAMVEERPVLSTYGLLELWQVTQKVGLVEAL